MQWIETLPIVLATGTDYCGTPEQIDAEIVTAEQIQEFNNNTVVSMSTFNIHNLEPENNALQVNNDLPESATTNSIFVQSSRQEEDHYHTGDDSENESACNGNNLNQLELSTVLANNPVGEEEDADDLSADLPEITVSANDLVEEQNAFETADVYTKEGNLRKRKKYNVNLKTRKQIKLNQIRENHKPLPSCDRDKCKKKCNIKISELRRSEINKQFWNMSWLERRTFIFSTCKRLAVKRRPKSAESEKKQNTFKYFFPDETETVTHEVCKIFFLTTLGYKETNDRIITDVLSKTKKGSLQPNRDKRGKHNKHNKFQHEDLLEQHIESFNPTISHYRREHAPHTRYLPSDVNISLMFNDFQEKYPNLKLSYELYRRKVKAMHISFALLGHEECEDCEGFKLHGHLEKNLQPDCEQCQIWQKHIDKAIKARNLYREHAEQLFEDGTVCCSADLQKVIMLPRIDCFKKVIFTKRIIAYHQSFVPVGKKTNKKPFACVWHEGITGRSKEDIVSTFYAFFLQYRDSPRIILWLDNCSSQNKNWCFLTFLIYVVNSDEMAIDEINIQYFVPGHTFMSADSFHHQVEAALKKQKKTYDFKDFSDAVQSANKSKVEVKEMKHTDFFLWKDFKSQQKLQKAENRLYLADIVSIKAVRGSYVLKCKTDLEQDDYITLDFLCKKNMKKNGIATPSPLSAPCGVPLEKRESILKNLDTVLPKNRKQFWEELAIITTP